MTPWSNATARSWPSLIGTWCLSLVQGHRISFILRTGPASSTARHPLLRQVLCFTSWYDLETYSCGEMIGLAFSLPAAIASRSEAALSSGCGSLAVAPGANLPEAMRSMVTG